MNEYSPKLYSILTALCCVNYGTCWVYDRPMLALESFLNRLSWGLSSAKLFNAVSSSQDTMKP